MELDEDEFSYSASFTCQVLTFFTFFSFDSAIFSHNIMLIFKKHSCECIDL